ncbi:Methyltransferase type 12 [Streptomyces bingchenggensis BCW-1]|uniref:Methyltransferase type 12 n=1 Tax=Streptomyces bingchenggensis (strain BCW-1) TaxID=749414 RepID=D7C6B7_STRBB|nr:MULTISPECIES: class I SAM-dependent methyltransferase [Streptomyces]ADI04105.1 Methyltransferase type 12 [Streptomyces bingchenggensis BCW-1]
MSSGVEPPTAPGPAPGPGQEQRPAVAEGEPKGREPVGTGLSAPEANRTPKKGDRAAAVAALRPRYADDFARGTDRFFEPPRADCPWCGSARLEERLRTTDLFQHKPGGFRLDRCRDCGHVFQNPRLSGEGLEFYYRDFYDGLGEKDMGGLFAGRRKRYVRRAESLRPFAEAPGNWLDVGTGHGHFCEAARSVFPGTLFDGLDLSAGVELAERAGRVTRGIRGGFVERVTELADGYDVVSMFHYLEHSTDPRGELRAARHALRPGGHLLIDVPDPESRFSRLLGRWWLPWLQPQHLHFVPVANLRKELSGLGFTVVAEEHAGPHDPVDLVGAVWLLLNAVAPPEDQPWLAQPPGRARRLLRTAIVLAGVPALLVTAALDHFLIRPLAGRRHLSNAYRVVARRD